MKIRLILLLTSIALLAVSCNKQNKVEKDMNSNVQQVKERLESYAPVKISADLSNLDDRQKILVQKLVEAGKICDELFWQQASPDAISVRDSLSKLTDADSKITFDYVKINYGPYDAIFSNERFVGVGPAKRPGGGGFYPTDMTKNEFEQYIKAHPDQAEAFKSQYTVIVRKDGNLTAVPYHEYYEATAKLADKLDEAAEYCDNESLKNYLKLRAQTFRTDDYFESDMAWMDVKNNDIDLVIGPIENYQDELFNYKTAYEAVVMVKDIQATQELEMYDKHIDDFEHNLPYDKKYIRKSAGSGNILQIMNVVYFGGDCQQGVKTIAASLPNDPKVHDLKGGKKSMYKNLMEAKFDKIVVPIADTILDPSLLPFVNKKAFTSFVTLHEVSHTLGRGFVYGKDNVSVRQALKERFSAIEEAKADILGLYNHKLLLEMKEVTDEYIKQTIATYIAGLYRSVRFGAEEAHGKANLIQMNYLIESGAIYKQANGKYNYKPDIFFDKVAELSKMILTCEAEGNYDGAGKIIEKYGKVTPQLQNEIDMMKYIPRDINTTYDY